MPQLLGEAERAAAMAGLAGWTYDAAARSIRRDFRFGNFSEAFAFMTRVALAAEKAGHHPDWQNGYGRVSIALSTHDAGGVTESDVRLAAAIDAIAGTGG